MGNAEIQNGSKLLILLLIFLLVQFFFSICFTFLPYHSLPQELTTQILALYFASACRDNFL